ncbi:uncharacterized protein E0L32_002219 [Thyridium curvatum]|uniref:SsuA/THI5-like domain-containing protein n=1 Tax=Thyridium curvatum TaxID=1093900 RepID=A0A507AI24_9PEZI|nr:uncharacterized protein E0L32_002219 [Thyridium curvatum]TPX06723.1 hypothetical protein E0L32_002219 [Thyridium curvatum]
MAEKTSSSGPSIGRSVTLHFIGDWGMANFHRICAFLSQQFSDRAGPRTRVATWSMRDGGVEGMQLVHDGEADLCIATPAKLMQTALTGTGLFARTGPMPSLRTLAVLPQRDRMLLAIDPKWGIRSWAELRRKKPALRIATSVDDGTNFIGYVAMRYMEAHGVTEETLKSWGGSYVLTTRPEQAIENMRVGNADAVLQEAIMTPWWRNLMENHSLEPIPSEDGAVARLIAQEGFRRASIRAGFWETIPQEIPTIDFSDFLIIVREDMPEDIAYLLTWCLVERRHELEAQYAHIPPERSPLSYPLDPVAMAKPSIPLHAGARRFYQAGGYLS